MLPPEFETKRLLLRGPTMKDLPSYEKYFIDWEVIRNLSSIVPWPYPDNGVEEHLTERVLPSQGKDRWVWGIFLKSNPDELIGAVDLWRPGKPDNRGFWLGRKFWGQGIMTEAVEPVMDFAFDELGFEKLVFGNAVGNISSRRIKEKTGCTYLFTEPFDFVDPDLNDHEIWELKKEDWEKYKAKRDAS